VFVRRKYLEPVFEFLLCHVHVLIELPVNMLDDVANAVFTSRVHAVDRPNHRFLIFDHFACKSLLYTHE
jgi:hypothetical protein